MRHTPCDRAGERAVRRAAWYVVAGTVARFAGVCGLHGRAALPGPLEKLAAERHCYFVKTHELPREGDRRPAVYLLRDGRDALVSFAWFVLAYERPGPREEFAAGKLHMAVPP